MDDWEEPKLVVEEVALKAKGAGAAVAEVEEATAGVEPPKAKEGAVGVAVLPAAPKIKGCAGVGAALSGAD